MEEFVMYLLGVLFMFMHALVWATRYGYIQSPEPMVACFVAFVAFFVVLAATWIYGTTKQGK